MRLVEGLAIGIVIAMLIVGGIYLIMVVTPYMAVSTSTYSQTSASQQQYTPQYDVNQQMAIAQMQVQISEINAKLAQVVANQNAAQQSAYQPVNQYEYYTPRYLDSYRDTNTRQYDLTVTVRDEADNLRIEDARVRVENSDQKTRYTDQDGEALFTNMQDDCYDITVTKSGYDTAVDSVCISSDRKVSVELFEE